MSTAIFGTADYIVFVLALCLSASTGVYFGCFGTKQKTATEYLFGKGQMKAVPIGLSIYSSAISAITIVGLPSEVYLFGTQILTNYIGVLLSLIITCYFVLPVFCGDLKLASPYEYFELRFNSKIRLMSTSIYVLHTLLYMPIILYASTANFSEITQIPLSTCTTIIGGICIFYTLLGGFQAVIWSDTLQATLMLGSCIFVMIRGIADIGGFTEIFNRLEEGKRLKLLTWDPNPFVRLTLWSSIIGMCFNHAAHSGCGASSIQRYMALKNEKQARISSWIGVLGSFVIGVVVCMIGITMFANYFDCDPILNKEVSSYTKLLSHYVAHIVDYPGFLGIFNAGILCAGLSSISAELNTVSGLIYHCFIKKVYKKNISESKGALIMKIIVLINGLYYLSLAPFLDKFKHLQAMAIGVTGVTYGSKIGIMVLGTTFPKCNSIGVASGAIISMILMAWINFGALYYDINSKYVLPLSTENCINNNMTDIFNMTTITPIVHQQNEVPLFIYKLSFMYYAFVGSILTITIGLIISYITGGNNNRDMDPNLFIPSVRPKKTQKFCDEKIKMLIVEDK